MTNSIKWLPLTLLVAWSILAMLTILTHRHTLMPVGAGSLLAVSLSVVAVLLVLVLLPPLPAQTNIHIGRIGVFPMGT
jgi:hypothetical protein